MRATSVGKASRRRQRRLGDLRDSSAGFRRAELAAGLATAAVVGQVLFAPATLLGAAALVAVGRASRWRPHWLAVGLAASIIWLCVVGPTAAATAFATGSQRLAGFLLAAALHARLLGQPQAKLDGAGRWLASGPPISMLVACGEAWLVLWLGWWWPRASRHSRWRWRPGLVAALRRRVSAAALTAGQTTTTDGCAIGVATDTGALVGFSWAEASRGVLLTGPDRDLAGLAITCAALRRRKSVVLLECGLGTATAPAPGGRAAVAERVGHLARSLGVPVTAAGADSAAALAQAIRDRQAALIPDGAGPAANDLAALLGELRDLGLQADCLTWINDVEFMDHASVVQLLALGPPTATITVMSTASAAHAMNLASDAEAVSIGPPAGAADPRWRPRQNSHGDMTMRVFKPRPGGSARSITDCRVLPITRHRRR